MGCQLGGNNFADVNYDMICVNIRLYVEYEQFKHVVHENTLEVLYTNHDKESINRIDVSNKNREVA